MITGIKNITLSANFYTVAIFIGGVGAIAYQFATQPLDTAKAFAGIIVPIVVGSIAAVRQSKANTDALAVMAPKVDQAVVQATSAATQASAAVDAVADNTTLTIDTKGLVNGQASEFRQQTVEFKAALVEISAQKAENAALVAEIAALVAMAKSVLGIQTAHDEGVETGKAQLLADTAAMAVATASDPDAPAIDADAVLNVTAPALINVAAPESS